MCVYLISSSYTVHLRLEVIHSNCTKNVTTAVSVHHTSVFVLLTCGIVFQLIVLTFLLLLPSNRQLNRSILVSFYSAMTTELVLAELLCCDCVFCNSLVFYVSAFYFILWTVVSAAYSALLSSSYFERINDDDDDEYRAAARTFCTTCSNRIVLTLRTTEEYETSQGRAGQPRGGHHTVWRCARHLWWPRRWWWLAGGHPRAVVAVACHLALAATTTTTSI